MRVCHTIVKRRLLVTLSLLAVSALACSALPTPAARPTASPTTGPPTATPEPPTSTSPPPTATPEPPTAKATGREVYRSDEYGFEIRYGEAFVQDPTCYPVVVRGSLATAFRLTGSEYYSETNLLDACVIVGVDQGEDASDTCLEPESTLEQPQGEEEINGVAFQTWTSEERAAGNVFEDISYRTIHGGDCYEIALLMHSGNIGAYTPGTVSEFDRQEITARLEQVLRTFRFLE